MKAQEIKLITGTSDRMYAIQHDSPAHREKMAELGFMAREVEHILRGTQLWRWEQMMAEGTLYRFLEEVADRCYDAIIDSIDAYRQTFGDMDLISQIPQIRAECLQKAVENAGIR